MRMLSLASAAAVAALSIGSATVLAATQGSLGSSSSGSVNISANINQLVRISALNDISLGTYTGTGGLTGRDDVCVFSNAGGYSITATGSGSGGAFSLAASGGATVPYSVAWATTAGANTGAQLTSGKVLAGQSGTFTNPTCQGGANLNASLLVSVTDEALAAAPAGAYTGTLTLTVAPQ